MKIATTNIEYVPDPPIEKFVLDRSEPHVVSIQQANRSTAALRRIKGYRLVGMRFGYEAHGVKALVRNDVKIIARKSLRMTWRWTGPKEGRAHDPRVYLALLIEIRGKRAWVVCVHWPTHNNTDAQIETSNRIREFADRHPNYPVIVAGDFNREEHELEGLAAQIDGNVATVGKVDHVLYTRAHLRHVSRRLAPENSPYHGWGVVTLDLQEKA